MKPDFGWHYPPGVSERDISYPDPIACGECFEGRLEVTPCCGAAFIVNEGEQAEGYHCIRCRKQYETRQCRACDGEGVSGQ